MTLLTVYDGQFPTPLPQHIGAGDSWRNELRAVYSYRTCTCTCTNNCYW